MPVAPWWEVSAVESSVTLDVTGCCQPAGAIRDSPIDEYYDFASRTIRLGDPALLKDHDVLGRLMLLGFVAGVDLYFRRIISGAVRICPISAKEAADQHLALGAISYYGPADVAMGVLERVSFATAGEVARTAKKLLAFEWRKGSSLDGAVRAFDVVCEMRHAAVHATGSLSSGNARVLGLLGSAPRVLVLDLASIHVIGETCHSVVRAFNRELCRRMGERWVLEGVLTGRWRRDAERVSQLYGLFRSRRDSVEIRSAYHMYQRLMGFQRGVRSGGTTHA